MFTSENRFLFRFARKSIWRNAGRSFFIGLSVSLAVIIAVWVVAFFDGVNHQIESSVINTNTGYFQLQEKSFAQTTDPSSPQIFNRDLHEKLTHKQVTFSPELVLDGNITAPEGAASLLALGIEPDLHRSFLSLHKHIIAGEFLTRSDVDGVLIGEELAKMFKLKVGDQLVFNYQDITGELRSELLNVRGIYNFSSNSFEKRFLYINQETWQKLYLNQYHGDIRFNRIAIMTPNLEWKEWLQTRIKDTPYVLKSWRDLNPEMSVVIEFNNGMIRMFFVIIAVTVLMTILTPVQMLWQERFRELKMLNTLGISNSRLWKMGLFEVVHMIAYSGIASALILLVILSIQTQTGVLFKFGKEGVNIERAGIKLTGVVYPVISPYQIAITLAFITLVLVISYVWAIHRTLSKLEAER